MDVGQPLHSKHAKTLDSAGLRDGWVDPCRWQRIATPGELRPRHHPNRRNVDRTMVDRAMVDRAMLPRSQDIAHAIGTHDGANRSALDSLLNLRELA